MYQIQMELELMYDSYQQFTAYKECVSELSDVLLEALGDSADLLDLLIDTNTHLTILHKANIPTILGVLASKYPDLQDTAWKLERLVSLKLLRFDQDYLSSRITIDQSIIDKCSLFMYKLPMVIKPKKIRHNKQDGYLTNNRSLLLNNSHHFNDICIDHINRVNCIALTLNDDTATQISNTWRNLAKQKSDETHDDFMRRRKAFEKYASVAKDLFNIFTGEFYLTHSYDKRGRTYCNGYHITYQGTDWNKAVIEFNNKEII